MPIKAGPIVKLSLLSPSKEFRINEHNLASGHSIEQVRKALNLSIERIERRPNNMLVHVSLENTGSGHMVPTGIPSRKLILTVTVQIPRRQPLKAQQVYRRSFANDRGEEILGDSEIMLKGHALAIDNRIAPREIRREVFSFPVPQTADATVMADLCYSYRPVLFSPQEMRIDIGLAKSFSSGGYAKK